MKNISIACLIFCGASTLWAAKPGPGFGLRNKTNGNISVNVLNGQAEIANVGSKNMYIPTEKGSLCSVNIDINQETQISIRDDKKKQVVYRATFSVGKTIT